MFGSRKPDKTEEEEALDACPFCSYPVPQTSLDCPECKQHLPYCVVTVSKKKTFLCYLLIKCIVSCISHNYSKQNLLFEWYFFLNHSLYLIDALKGV